jgi:hypothetical protein
MNRVKLIYLSNLMLFVQFILVGGSGLIMYFNHQAGGAIMRWIHDQIGILMLVFFVAHIILNWRWIVATTKRLFKKGMNLKEKTKFRYLVDLALFVQFLLVGGTGLIMYFYHHAGGSMLRLIHDKVGILMLVFFVVHMVLNWRWIASTTNKLFKRRTETKESGIVGKDHVTIN